APPCSGRWRYGLAVERQVVSDHPEAIAQRLVLEDMPPLPGIGAGGVLQQERNAVAALFEVDAMFDAVEIEMNVTADRMVETGRWLAHDRHPRINSINRRRAG